MENVIFCAVLLVADLVQKPTHSNERVHFKLIDRASKMQFKEGLPRFLWLTIPELWKLLKNQFCYILVENNILIESWKLFCHKTKVSTLQKVLKGTILSVMAIKLW